MFSEASADIMGRICSLFATVNPAISGGQYLNLVAPRRPMERPYKNGRQCQAHADRALGEPTRDDENAKIEPRHRLLNSNEKVDYRQTVGLFLLLDFKLAAGAGSVKDSDTWGHLRSMFWRIFFGMNELMSRSRV